MSGINGLPEEFEQRMRTLLGSEYEAFAASFAKPFVRSLRVSARKGEGGPLPFPLEPVPWEERGFYFTEPEDADYALDLMRPGKHPLHEAGAYYIQEASAMSAVCAAEAARPFGEAAERVLDLCAAPGGKSSQLFDHMGGRGLLVSNEIHPGRAKILSRNLERMGCAAVVTNESPETLASHFPSFFDRILVDAPCSGEGMFKKEKVALDGWSLSNITLCANRQDGILERAASMLKPGGQLVYSTCTFAPEECEGSIERFLAGHPDFEQADLPAILGEKMEAFGFREDFSGGKGIRLLPHRLSGEGHFAAVLFRKGTWVPDPFTVYAGEKEESGRRKKKADGTAQLLQAWERFAEEMLVCGSALPVLADTGARPALFSDTLVMVPDGLSLAGLKTERAGLVLGSLKKDRFVPDHALAMAVPASLFRSEKQVALTEKEACAYLRGEALSNETGAKGDVVLTLSGTVLGFGRASGGRINNSYPKGLRRPY